MHLEESHVVEKERVAESDLQMHPLLFQAPEDGRLPYYPLNTGTGTSSSFSFFSANQLQLNMSLFHNPCQVSHVGRFNESLKTKESSNTASSAIDFHPLLKISENANGDSVTAPSTASESNEKANNLDLEIHLSSSPTKKRALVSRDMTAQNLMRYVLSGHLSDLPSTRNIDDIGDHSNPGIVMEQEELSESDEEIEEHVEFECEEMTDSEVEEGSGYEQIPEMQEKGSVLVPRNASPFLKLGLITMGKDTTSSSWLSLNSCAPGHPARTKHKNTEGTISEAPSAKDIASPANRSFKKTTPTTKKVAEQKDATDVAQQLSLSPTVRKPRKPVCHFANLKFAFSSSLHSSSLQPLRSLRSPPLQSNSSGSNPVLLHSRSPSSFSFNLQVFKFSSSSIIVGLLFYFFLPCRGWSATLQFRHLSVVTSTSVQSLHSSTSSLQRFNLFNHRRRHLKAYFLLAIAGLLD
ncbi:hypothetical protein Patl1_24602 [Pistacia atlantica]|uniref:Uncharacterized protein n=1 Tax=Pistacia atlantica TaxID=434234 RepID=A0ACC0ZXQ5_9ROSI|nr:hypothetical protein Patl1_24602 [Pistacia atlantica]